MIEKFKVTLFSCNLISLGNVFYKILSKVKWLHKSLSPFYFLYIYFMIESVCCIASN